MPGVFPKQVSAAHLVKYLVGLLLTAMNRRCAPLRICKLSLYGLHAPLKCNSSLASTGVPRLQFDNLSDHLYASGRHVLGLILLNIHEIRCGALPYWTPALYDKLSTSCTVI